MELLERKNYNEELQSCSLNVGRENGVTIMRRIGGEAQIKFVKELVQ